MKVGGRLSCNEALPYFRLVGWKFLRGLFRLLLKPQIFGSHLIDCGTARYN